MKWIAGELWAIRLLIKTVFFFQLKVFFATLNYYIWFPKNYIAHHALNYSRNWVTLLLCLLLIDLDGRVIHDAGKKDTYLEE